jgi:hypothetical protein
MKRLVALGSDDKQVAPDMGDAFGSFAPSSGRYLRSAPSALISAMPGGRLITVNSVPVVVE